MRVQMLQALTEPDFRDVYIQYFAGMLGEFKSLLSPVLFGVLRETKQVLAEAGNQEMVAASVQKGSFQNSGPDDEDNAIVSELVGLLVTRLAKAVCHASSDAVFLLDRRACIHGLNDAAQRMIETKALRVDEEGGLSFKSISANRIFRTGLDMFFLHKPDQLRHLVDKDMVVIFRPAFPASEIPLAMVLVRRLVEPLDVPVAEVRRVLGVSHNQARLAQAVMKGFGPVDYARDNQCSVKLARYHLYELMKRLDCHSQTELLEYLLRVFG